MTYTLTTQGHTVEIRYNLQSTPTLAGGGRRSRIADFSRASRRRLLELCNRLDVKKVNSKFITLTFSKQPTHAAAKAAFKRFTMRMRRKWPLAAAIWRMEYQQRGSVHFHLIAFNLPYVPQRLLQAIWTDCTGEDRSIVDIRLVRGHRMLLSYVSKYIAKRTHAKSPTSLDIDAYQHAAPEDDCGRFWGVLNRAGLPFAVALAALLVNCETARYIQWSMAASTGFRLRRSSSRMTLFADDAFLWLQRLLQLNGEAWILAGWNTDAQLDTALNLIPAP